MDEERPFAAARILPFVIAVRRDQAAPPLDGVLEGGLFPDRLGARIDQQRKSTGILDPGRNQAPAHQPEMPAAILQHHHWDRLGRRNIVARRKIGLLDVAENLPKSRRRRG